MATAYYTVRVETNYGDFMEFEFDYDVFDDDEDFEPMADHIQREIYDAIMQNLYVEVDFSHMED